MSIKCKWKIDINEPILPHSTFFEANEAASGNKR